MAYIYLYGVIAYACIWCIFFIFRRDLRKKLFLSSLLAAPLGISEIIFIPGYWVPQFQTIHILKELFLEDILFCFFLGGVVSILYQVLFKKGLFKFKRINPSYTLITPILFLSYFLGLFSLNVMYYVFISMFIGSFIVISKLGKKSINPIILSGILNTLVYAILYYLVWYSFPQLPASYQYHNLSGVLLAGIPIEEFLYKFSFCLYWTPIYEIWRSYFRKK